MVTACAHNPFDPDTGKASEAQKVQTLEELKRDAVMGSPTSQYKRLRSQWAAKREL